ncbi:MAG TPA: efflux RND transporter periplasmic adaptor subunit [Chthoniobacteraceae bacterium]|nr:efflux RND transporter periplasmic adaptor subunit [Chthoniobacteraceae bacterium]
MNLPRIALSLVLLAVAARAEEIQGLVVPLKSVSVASPVLQEVVDQVLVEEGDTVKEGQPIVQLRAEKEALQVEQYKKVVEQKAFSAKGAAALAKEKMMSREAVLEKETELQLAEINLRQAEVLLKEKTIRSPLNGLVVKKYKESGESVDRVEKLVDVVNIDDVYVQFYVDPKLMSSVKENQVVPVRFPVIGDRKFDAKVAFVDPRIDATSGLFRVKLLVANAGHTIKPGMRGVADFAQLTAAR